MSSTRAPTSTLVSQTSSGSRFSTKIVASAIAHRILSSFETATDSPLRRIRSQSRPSQAVTGRAEKMTTAIDGALHWVQLPPPQFTEPFVMYSTRRHAGTQAP